MYRVDGPVEMRPVGEVEFVAGIAAMSASGGYGPIKVAQGIVGYADLALGDRVEPVLEALIRAGGGRFSGVRYSVGYDADPTIGNSRPDSAPHMYARPDIRAGVARLAHGRELEHVSLGVAQRAEPEMHQLDQSRRRLQRAAQAPDAVLLSQHVALQGAGHQLSQEDRIAL